MPNPNPLSDDINYDENSLRALANGLARKQSRTPDEELLLRDTRRKIHSSMALEVDPHLEHLLYERIYRFNNTNTPITNIKVDGRRTSASLAQAVWAADAGMSLEDLVRAKTKVNRRADKVRHDTDYRSGCLTLDGVDVQKQRETVELASVPEQFWGCSWNPETDRWFARVRINKSNTHWSSIEFSDIRAALKVLDFAQRHKEELTLINTEVDDMSVNIWTVLNRKAKSTAQEIELGFFKFPEHLSVPSDQIIENLKENSRRSIEGQKARESRRRVPSNESYIDTGAMPPIVVNEELKRNAPWLNLPKNG